MPHTHKIIVLDDDPTGIQTVHGCLLITRWDEATVSRAFADEQPFFYILTNTRAMTRQQAATVTRQAVETVVRVNRRFGFRLILVSRSDSCLRGHFPLETDVMRQVLSEQGLPVWPRVPFCPAFIEAGRLTIGGVHYMRSADGALVPVSETEFARDNVFAYHTSVLTDYIREKGARPADYEVVDAQTYDDLRRYADRLLQELSQFPGAVVVRCSSSLPKVLSGIPDVPLLSKQQLHLQSPPAQPPLFIVGSHVQKTTRQLQQLLSAPGTQGIEVDVQRMLGEAPALLAETLRAIRAVARRGLAPVVYTSRLEVRLADADQRQHLGQQVSRFLVDLVRRLPFAPAYLVAKGGITSHDVLTHGLGVSTARVMGQVVPSVPCVMTARFPYIIFPGNVGADDSLRQLYEKLSGC